MRQYRYVIVQSDGISHELWDSWEQYETLDQLAEEDEEEEPDRQAWHSRKTLPELLKEGWRPVRETPMGAARDGAYSLVLLEKE